MPNTNNDLIIYICQETIPYKSTKICGNIINKDEQLCQLCQKRKKGIICRICDKKSDLYGYCAKHQYLRNIHAAWMYDVPLINAKRVN